MKQYKLKTKKYCDWQITIPHKMNNEEFDKFIAFIYSKGLNDSILYKEEAPGLFVVRDIRSCDIQEVNYSEIVVKHYIKEPEIIEL